MGIQGFFSLLRLNPDLRRQHLLHDTKIVIDGSNLLYALYDKTTPDRGIFGGDYMTFSIGVERYFKALMDCGIEPVVILDGPHRNDQVKIGKLVNRRYRRIEIMKQLSDGDFYNVRLLPILAHDVYRETLKRLGIPVIHSLANTVQTIAYHATFLKCPILTHNSELYLYDLPNGIIANEFLQIEVCEGIDEQGQKFKGLQCGLYKRQYIQDRIHNVRNDDLWPMLGALVGDNADVFFTFFDRCDFTRVKWWTVLRISKSFPYHERFCKAMLWLRQRSSYQTISKILECYHDDPEKQKVAKQTLDQWIKRFKLLEIDVFKVKQEVIAPSGYVVPEWFVKAAISECRIPVYLIDIICSKRVFPFPQVEDCAKLSCYECTIDLRRYLYAFLLRDECEFRDIFDDCGVSEFDRLNMDVVESSLKPNFEHPQLGRLPGLADIDAMPRMAIETMFRLLLCVNDGILDKFVVDVRILVATLRWWMKKSKYVNCIGAKAMLLCHIALSACFEDQCSHLFPNMVCNYSRLKLFFNLDDDNKTEKKDSSSARVIINSVDLRILHCFSELQAVMSYLKTINRLLGCPYPDLDLTSSFSGMFLYRITERLELEGENCDKFIAWLLDDDAVAFKDFERVYTILSKDVSFAPTPSVAELRRERKNREMVAQLRALDVNKDNNSSGASTSSTQRRRGYLANSVPYVPPSISGGVPFPDLNVSTASPSGAVSSANFSRPSSSLSGSSVVREQGSTSTPTQSTAVSTVGTMSSSVHERLGQLSDADDDDSTVCDSIAATFDSLSIKSERSSTMEEKDDLPIPSQPQTPTASCSENKANFKEIFNRNYWPTLSKQRGINPYAASGRAGRGRARGFVRTTK